MFDRTVVMPDQRSKSTFLSDPPSHFRGISVREWVNLIWVSVSLKILSLNTSVDFYKLLSNTCAHVKPKGFLVRGCILSSSSWWNWPSTRRWHWCIFSEWWKPHRMIGWSWMTGRRWMCSVCSCWHSRCVWCWEDTLAWLHTSSQLWSPTTSCLGGRLKSLWREKNQRRRQSENKKRTLHGDKETVGSGFM